MNAPVRTRPRGDCPECGSEQFLWTPADRTGVRVTWWHLKRDGQECPGSSKPPTEVRDA